MKQTERFDECEMFLKQVFKKHFHREINEQDLVEAARKLQAAFPKNKRAA